MIFTPLDYDAPLFARGISLRTVLSQPSRHRYEMRRSAQRDSQRTASRGDRRFDETGTRICLLCDACGMPLQKGGEMVLVFTKKVPNGNWIFVKNSTPQWCSEYRSSNCGKTWIAVVRAPGCATLHDECFNFVVGSSPSRAKVNCLGRALVWRICILKQYAHFVQYYRAPEPDGFPQELIIAAAKQVGVPMLERFASEIVTLIHAYSRDAAFWGLVKVLSLKLRLAAAPCDTPLVSTPLATLVSWERGDMSPVLSEVPRPATFFCITLDSDGVRQIKPLANFSGLVSQVRRRTQTFLIANKFQVQRIVAHFKDGMCWLGRPIDHPDSHTFNTPAPPLGFEGCSMISRVAALECTYFETISLDRNDITGMTGMTFEISRPVTRPGVFDIICHTRADPWKPTQTRARSVYLPMPPNDKILWLQVRSSTHDRLTTSIMLETKLSGVIHIGPQHTTPFTTTAFSNLPQLLICKFRNSLSGQEVLAVYPRGDLDNTIALDEGTRGPHILPSAVRPFPRFWAWAPLEGIQHVRVFQQPVTRCFRGMHITYENGGQRFLGEATGCDEVVDWSEPSRMNIGIVPLTRLSRWVSFSPSDEELDLSTCKQYSLEGEFHYWHGHGWEPHLRILPSGSWRRAYVID